jgi:hypothetical protein
MLRSGAKVHEKRFVRGDLLGVGDEADGLVDEVFGEVVTLRRSLLWLNGMVIVDELGVILVRVAA